MTGELLSNHVFLILRNKKDFFSFAGKKDFTKIAEFVEEKKSD